MKDVVKYVLANDILIFDHGLHYSFTKAGRALFHVEMTNLLQTLLNGQIPSSSHHRHDNNDDNARRNITSGPPPLSHRRVPWTLLAWRETSASHYPSTTGRFVDQRHWRCVPTKRKMNQTGQRIPAHAGARPLMDHVLASLNMSWGQDLEMLPFYHYSSKFADLHPTRDCTHYCYMPSFWLYLWRKIRIAIDQAAIKHNDKSV
jgi:hypothetical protein